MEQMEVQNKMTKIILKMSIITKWDTSQNTKQRLQYWHFLKFSYMLLTKDI